MSIEQLQKRNLREARAHFRSLDSPDGRYQLQFLSSSRIIERICFVDGDYCQLNNDARSYIH